MIFLLTAIPALNGGTSFTFSIIKAFTFVLVGKSCSIPYFRTILDVCRSDCLPCGFVILVLMKASIYQPKKRKKEKVQ